MKTEMELIALFKKNNFDYYESRNDLEGVNTIELSTTDVTSVINFAKKHNIDTIFYYINFMFEEMLSIDEDTIEGLDLDDNVINTLRPKFDSYNKRVQRLDFSKSFAVYVYCIYQGFLIFAGETDYWFIDLGFNLSEKAAQQIVLENQDEIFDIVKKSKEERVKVRKELRKLLLNSEEFQRCTNRELRNAFIKKFFDENEKYRDAFYNEREGLYDITINSFIEEVWRDYKQNK